MGNEEQRRKRKAVIATVVVHAAVLIVLLLTYLHYQYEPVGPGGQGNSFYGGEYVMLGDAMRQARGPLTPEPQQAPSEPEPVASGAQSSALVTADEPSPMKVKPKEDSEKTEPTPEEIAEQKRKKAEEERRKAEQETRRRTNSKVQNAFGKAGSDDSGNAGTPDGNSDNGARSGAPGVSGLNGYTLANWGHPSSPVDGRVVIKVRVDANGKVVSATYSSGSGTAAANMSVRRRCEQASLQSSFSVPAGTTADAEGYITWRFE